MRWWYIVTLVRNIVTIVHWSAKIKGCKASGRANCCSFAPNPPPKGDQFPGNDVPGHATRLVATQQPDIALHFTTPLACGWCRCQDLQAYNDKSCKLGQIRPTLLAWTAPLHSIDLLPKPHTRATARWGPVEHEHEESYISSSLHLISLRAEREREVLDATVALGDAPG